MSEQRSAGNVVVQVYGRTDVGRTREHNEDAFLVADMTTGSSSLDERLERHVVGERGSLFMVADGMGGAAAGEIASAMAVETVLEELRTRWVRNEKRDAESFAAALKVATDVANARIHRIAREQPEYRGMGTTATIAGILGDTLYLAQVGDSRAYIIRNGIARQITKDQSLMQRLIDAGEMTEEEAEQSERRNIILQALGPEPSIRTDITHQQLRRGDILVLCSDGLSGLVRPQDIATIVTGAPDLRTACKRLIERANENGGPDNITVIVARFDGDALSSAAAGDALGHQVYSMPGDVTPTIPMDPWVAREPAEAGIVPRVAGNEHHAASWTRRVLMLATVAVLVTLAWVAWNRSRAAADTGSAAPGDTRPLDSVAVPRTSSP